MRWLSRCRACLNNLLRRDRVEQDLDDELRSYAEMLADENTAKGMNAGEARRNARIQIAGIEQVKEEVRTMRTGASVESFWQDLRYGARMLRKKPGFTAVAVVTLALGIGANTAIFSIIDAALLTPLPIPSPDRVVMVWSENPARHWHDFPASVPDYLDWKASGIFETLAAFDSSGFNLRIGNQTERVDGVEVTPEWFEIAHAIPYLGRTLEPSDTRLGQDQVVVLGYDLWSSRFGADPHIIGKEAIVNGVASTVVGVLPRNFAKFGHEQLYAPLLFRPPASTDRGSRSMGVVGRLRDGLTLASAQGRIDIIAARLARSFPAEDAGIRVRLQPVEEANVEDIRSLLLVLFGAVGFVLLVACANVANLLLVRGAGRQKEMAIRTALGAGRGRLTRQLLLESVLLALLGAIAGTVPAWAGIHFIRTFKFDELPSPDQINLNFTVLLFTFSLAMLTGILFGMIPAWQAWRSDINEPLKDTSRAQTSVRQGKVGSLFVVAEVAFTVVLLAGAGLMLRSFIQLRSANPGYDPRSVLAMDVALSANRYATPDQQRSFVEEAVTRLRNLPGAEAAAATDSLTGGDSFHGRGLHIPGRPEPKPGEQPVVLVSAVTRDYFQTLNIPLLLGRHFSEGDRANAPGVVIIDKNLANLYWPNQDPIGQPIKLGAKEPSLTIVGVVGDVEQNPILKMFAGGRPGQIYLPFAQNPAADLSLVVSAHQKPAALASAARAAIAAIDPDEPLFHIRTLDELRAESRTPARLGTVLLGFFGAVALLLAAIGIYGVISYRVEQRTRELGIRIALGAKRGDLLALVLGRGGLLIVIGAALGLAAAFVLTRAMRSLLYEVAPNDPQTFIAVTVLLAAVGLLATYIPARRASSVDPTVALRSE